MSPVLEALEALAITIPGFDLGAALTEQEVLEARIRMAAPAGLPCMIVAPPLQPVGVSDARRVA